MRPRTWILCSNAHGYRFDEVGEYDEIGIPKERIGWIFRLYQGEKRFQSLTYDAMNIPVSPFQDTIPVKSETDIEMINMKATILLAYGYVTIACPVDQLTQKLEATILRFLLPYFEGSKVIFSIFFFFISL